MDNKKDIFLERRELNPYTPADGITHIYGQGSNMCETEARGYKTSKNRNLEELVLDASDGFIPLWKQGVSLRWRFSPSLYNYFQNPDSAMDGIRELFSKALIEWQWSPIKFKEKEDAWDFEIVVKNDNCTPRGCVLASAFFPDGGRHKLVIYPKLFTQSRDEQVETFAHELGHIFGLRHFFAELSEKDYPSVKFGKHEPFTIMNYGNKSKMTDDDRNDLKELYKKVWNNELQEINGTRIVTFYPFSMQGGVGLTV